MPRKYHRKNTIFSCHFKWKGVFALSHEANFEYLNADFLHKSVSEFYGAVYDTAMTSVVDFLDTGVRLQTCRNTLRQSGILLCVRLLRN